MSLIYKRPYLFIFIISQRLQNFSGRLDLAYGPPYE